MRLTLLAISFCAFGLTAQAAELPTTTVLPAGGAHIILPLRSDAYLTPHNGDPADTIQLAKDDYTVACRRAAFAVNGVAMYSIHGSDIPELDMISRAEDRSIVTAATCNESTVATAEDGFIQAAGTLNLAVDTDRRPFDSSKRHIYQIDLPVLADASWESVETGEDAYAAACLQLKNNLLRTSTLYAYCEAPTVKVQCCGQIDVSGSFHALVFAYEAPAWETKTFTADTPLAANAQGQAYLNDASVQLKSDLAIAFCAPAKFAYAPIMAYQANCFTLKQTYQTTYTEAVRCVAEVPSAHGPLKLWARVLTENGVTSLAWIAKDSQMQSSSSGAGTFAADGSSISISLDDGHSGQNVVTLSAPGVDLRQHGNTDFPADLKGMDTQERDAPANVAMRCSFK